MSDDNVVDLVERIERLKKQSENKDVDGLPDRKDLETFIKVLSFIRSLSMSGTGKLEFIDDHLTISLTHYMEHTEINDGDVTTFSALHEEAEMFWDLSSDDGHTEKEALDVATNALSASLNELTLWKDKGEEE